MRLVTLGTGTVALSPTRVCAGYFVHAGEIALLLDCGSGVVHRLVEHGLDWARITHVAFTHFHTDHISDFATLMQAWRYGQLPPRSEICAPTPSMENFASRVTSADPPPESRAVTNT